MDGYLSLSPIYVKIPTQEHYGSALVGLLDYKVYKVGALSKKFERHEYTTTEVARTLRQALM